MSYLLSAASKVALLMERRDHNRLQPRPDFSIRADGGAETSQSTSTFSAGTYDVLRSVDFGMGFQRRNQTNLLQLENEESRIKSAGNVNWFDCTRLD